VHASESSSLSTGEESCILSLGAHNAKGRESECVRDEEIVDVTLRIKIQASQRNARDNPDPKPE
jgi:hypothetical protein